MQICFSFYAFMIIHWFTRKFFFKQLLTCHTFHYIFLVILHQDLTKSSTCYCAKTIKAL